MGTAVALNPIDNVIAELHSLIRWTLTQPSRIGFFASLYLRVTQTIRSKIGAGFFDDDARMQTLDAAFANRYLSAVQQFRSNDPALPKSWAVALNAANRTNLLVVQHLLLSMNPHINIDLAAAAAQTCPGNSIAALRGDFDKVNSILASIVPTVLSELGSLSPFLHLLSDLSEDGETTLINFSLVTARDASWAMAQKLAALPASAQEQVIADENTLNAVLGNAIRSPGLVISGVLDIIRQSEVQDVARIIQVLDSGNPLTPRPAAAALSAAAFAETAASPAASPAAAHPNQVYYFEIAPGSWAGSFHFQITNWRTLWSSSMSLKNKLLSSAMQIFQSIFGDSAISSQLTPLSKPSISPVVSNHFRIHKSWFTLWRSDEQYTLSPDGHRVQIDAHVSFGPFAFLFPEHDVYPATVIDGGMRNLYRIKLLGTRFLGDYRVQPDRRQVISTLSNDWSIANETLNKL